MVVVLFFRDNDNDIRYGLAGRRGYQRTGEDGCRASVRGLQRVLLLDLPLPEGRF